MRRDIARAGAEIALIMPQGLADQVAVAREGATDRDVDAGLGRISAEKRQSLQHTYDAFDHPAANEVLRWLAGEYQVTDEMVATQ